MDVLTDVLGSDGRDRLGWGDLRRTSRSIGDFGDVLTTKKPATSPTATVTGFTGKLATAGLVEFGPAPSTRRRRVWVQDDRYRGTTTRAASMNRYAYVEGAPESFVDVLGFYRARAAVRAQKVAALQAAFQSALDELNRIVASQARLPGAWTVAQMMASYNQFHASDDPTVRAAMDQIAREAFYGVTDYKYQQKIQVALAEQAVEAARRQQALQIEARATAERDYYRAVAGMSADPLAPPEVFEDKGFFGNRLEIVKGYWGEAWNTATSMATSGFDTSPFSFVFRRDQFEEAAAQQHDAFWGGIEENGVLGQLTIQFNPIYQGMDAYVGAQEALDRGDYRAVGENAFKFDMAVVTTAAIAIPGAQLVVGLTRGLFAELAVASQAEANIVRVETAIANAMERTAAAEANGATATVWMEGTTTARATLTAEVAAANTSLVSAPDSAVFWSGLGPEGAEAAAQWAAENGGVTLEQTLVDAGIKPPGWAEDPGWWTDASRSFAQRASGDVRVVLGDNVNPGGTWAQTEFPALKANPNVRSITVVNPATGEQTLIWSR